MVLRERGEDINAVRAVQQFIGEGAWDDDRLLERHQQLVAQDLGEADGVMIVDGSGFPKKGDHSVGVQRQYCGALSQARQLPARSLRPLRFAARPHLC
jgi:SRSO17 transposase